MPGLFGAIFRDEPQERREKMIGDALTRMTHRWDYVRDPVFHDDTLAAGRVHTGIAGEKTSPVVRDRIRVWVEGEAHNTAELAAAFAPGEQSFAGVLARTQRDNRLDEALARTDGSFTVAVYDAERQLVRLAGDRYGTRPLYVLDADGRFAWAGELKAFLALDGFPREVLPEAVQCFMSLGHLLGDLTWFRGVTLIPAAAVITRDLRGGTTQCDRYWSWGRIRESRLGPDEAAGALGDLFEQAVAERWQPGAGLGLSGGMDSRAILAGLPDPARTPCYTFGAPGCWDIIIARKAAEVRGALHTVFSLLPEHWYDGREDGVIRTDGMQNLLHMHAAPVLAGIIGLVRINLNGIFGGVIGGYYLRMAGSDRTGKRPDAALAQRLWGKFARFDDPADTFYDIASPDPYIINGRLRRFSVTGSTNHGAFIEQRNPLLDNRVVEFVYSLPDRIRSEGLLYHTMLLKRWPELFADIPWQSTGIPVRAASGPGGTMHKLHHLGHRLRLLEHPQCFTDYPRWIRQPLFSEHFRALLDPRHAVYPEYTGADYRRKFLYPHLARRANNADMICRALTLERWLRYVHDVPMPDTDLTAADQYTREVLR